MLQPNAHDNDWSLGRLLLVLAGVLLVLIVLALAAFVVLVTGLPVTNIVSQALDALFAASSVQAMWYVTRAAGIVAHLLLWLATAYGVAVSSKVLEPVLHSSPTYDFHEFLSLLAIGFVALHVLVLLADRYLPFSIAAILVPFIAPYRPLWVGIGVIGFYMTLLVTITFYVRQRIGIKTFRVIHLLSYITFVFAVIHGLMAGTDSPLAMTLWMYAGTTLVIVFLTTYRIAIYRIHLPSKRRDYV